MGKTIQGFFEWPFAQTPGRRNWCCGNIEIFENTLGLTADEEYKAPEPQGRFGCGAFIASQDICLLYVCSLYNPADLIDLPGFLLVGEPCGF
jgi:hypothetical protein